VLFRSIDTTVAKAGFCQQRFKSVEILLQRDLDD